MGKVKEYYYDLEQKEIESEILNYPYAEGHPVPFASLRAIEIHNKIQPHFFDIEDIEVMISLYYDEKLCNP